MTAHPQDEKLVERVAEAIYKVAANHGAPDSWPQFAREQPEVADIFREEARAALKAAFASLTEAPDTQPGFPARALHSFDDPRPAGRD